jgi:antitoxin (DNA-binding transcriptional repressor) of toxin-antitoxin stability system
MAKVARSTRAVSARELSRRMAKLLDEIEADGSALVVVRYGRPSAMVVPFEESADVLKLPRLGDVAAGVGTDRPVEDDPQAEEDALARVRQSELLPRLLRDIADPQDGRWTPQDSDTPPLELNLALGGLELDGLIERGPGAIRLLTRRGERVLARLLNSTG